MSLYHVQKFLYQLNRDQQLQRRTSPTGRQALAPYELTDEEVRALIEPDIGLLFHLGVNGQILMHFAAFHQIAWAGLPPADARRHRRLRPGARRGLRGDRVRRRRRRLGDASQAPTAGGTTMTPRLRRRLQPRAGIVEPGRAGRPGARDALYVAFDEMREQIEATRPDALVVVARGALRQLLHGQHAELRHRHGRLLRRTDRGHGLARHRAGRVPGNRDLSERIIREVMETSDVSYAEEWRFDHGIMVPLHFLTPRYDLPVIPVNINCQGPPLTPLHQGVGVRRGAAAGRRRGTRARRHHRDRWHLALARHARFGEDQRGLGP